MSQCGAIGSLERHAVVETASTVLVPRPATATELRLLIQWEHGLWRNSLAPCTSVNR